MRWLLDQGALLALSGASGPSVIRIREEGLKGPAICDVVIQLSDQFAEALSLGCFLTATLHKARLRMLPINP